MGLPLGDRYRKSKHLAASITHFYKSNTRSNFKRVKTQHLVRLREGEPERERGEEREEREAVSSYI